MLSNSHPPFFQRKLNTTLRCVRIQFWMQRPYKRCSTNIKLSCCSSIILLIIMSLFEIQSLLLLSSSSIIVVAANVTNDSATTTTTPSTNATTSSSSSSSMTNNIYNNQFFIPGQQQQQQSGTVSSCAIPSYQSNNNPINSEEQQQQQQQQFCTATASSTSSSIDFEFNETNDTRLDLIAMYYAPIVFYHPKEKYTLSSVQRTFNNPSTILLHQNQVIEQSSSSSLNLATLLNTTRDINFGFYKESYNFQRNLGTEEVLTEDAVAGGGYNPRTGQSNAPIYYNFYIDEATQSWVFNYWFYYQYNGPINVAAVTQVPTSDDDDNNSNNNNGVNLKMTMNDTIKVTNFQLRPQQEHENDWECITIRVCPITSESIIGQLGIYTDTVLVQQVLNSLPHPLSISYQQYSSYRETFDCLQGQCIFYQNTNDSTLPSSDVIGKWHAIGFVSYGTHTTYAISATNMIYKELSIANLIVGVQGLFLVDHTNYIIDDGDNNNNNTNEISYHYFAPNSTNVIRHQNPGSIQFNTTTSTIEPDSSKTQHYWQGYAGRWGGYNTVRSSSNASNDGNDSDSNNNSTYAPICWNDNVTQTVPCSTLTQNDPILYSLFQFLSSLLNTTSSSNTTDLDSLRKNQVNIDTIRNQITTLRNEIDVSYQLYSLLSNINWDAIEQSIVSSLWGGTGIPPRGPITYPYFYKIIPGRNTPIRDQVGNTTTSVEFCNNLITSSNRTSGTNRIFVNELPLKSNLIGIVIMCCLCVILNVVVFTHPKTRGYASSIIEFNLHTGHAIPPSFPRTWYIVFQPAISYCGFYFLTMFGLILYFHGYATLLRLLSETLYVSVDSIQRLSFLFGITVVLIDTILAVFIWFPSQTLWLQIQVAYYDLVADEARLEQYKRKIRCEGRASMIFFQIMYGVLFNSLILSVLCVLIGSLDVGLAYSITRGCLNVVVSANNVCFDLYQWGIQIECGEPMQQFCNQWADKRSLITLWGSVIAVAGQYYLISSCGSASSNFKSIPFVLHLLPSREEYHKHIIATSQPSNQLNNFTRSDNLTEEARNDNNNDNNNKINSSVLD